MSSGGIRIKAKTVTRDLRLRPKIGSNGVSVVSMHGRRVTWLSGGIGLIACGFVGVLQGSALGTPSFMVVSYIAGLLWAGAILVLAVGLSREGSVVARKPLGLAASAVVAVWPLIAVAVTSIASPFEPQHVQLWLVWGYLAMILPLLAGAIAAVQVGRARVVPRPWNWAPLWVLATQVALSALSQLIRATAPDVVIWMPRLLEALGNLGVLAGTFGLGILATVLATRVRVETVEILRSGTSD